VVSKGLRGALIIIALSFAAGFIGILIGHKYIMPDAGKVMSLHDQVHNRLALDVVQNQKIHDLEELFSQQKKGLELRMKKTNARLSAAMQNAHEMSPEVLAAKQEYVNILEELQTLSIEHIFAMRRLMNAQQAAQFDEIVQSSFRNISH
jgi:nickel and cobalt resistance protein CnrR